MNDDVKAMVRWARGMTESALTSSGSMTAEVEVSDDRLARHVVVRRDGKVEYDSLFVQGSRIRPEFYPSDLPFFAGETVHISPKGAFWLRTSPSVEDRVAKIQESVQEMMTDPRMPGFMSLVLSPSGAADDLFERLLQHHRDEGWDLVPDEAGATPGRNQVATRGDERRKLSLIDAVGSASASLTRL